jgi:hypothetical protein
VPARRHRQRLAGYLVDGAGVVLEAVGGGGHLAARGGDRLTGVAGLESGEALAVLAQPVGDAAQQLPALAAAHEAPIAAGIESRMGGAHGALDVLLARLRHLRQHGAVGGSGDRRLPTIRGGHPPALDQQPGERGDLGVEHGGLASPRRYSGVT